jgi:hypothetical protein
MDVCCNGSLSDLINLYHDFIDAGLRLEEFVVGEGHAGERLEIVQNIIEGCAEIEPHHANRQEGDQCEQHDCDIGHCSSL